MNKLVIFPLILCVVHAADKPIDVKAKTSSSPVNTIQQNTKYQMIYQPVKYQQPVHLQLQPMHHIQALQQLSQLQQKPQYVPIQLLSKQFYVPQSQPQAMIIIAQPAYLPHSLVYGSATQQLLNYFQNNPQAKYHLLYGNYQQQQQQQPPQTQEAQTQSVQPTATYMHPVIASPLGNYILTSAKQVTTHVAAQPQLVAQPSATPVLQYSSQQSQLPVEQYHQLQHLQPVQQVQQAQLQVQQQAHQQAHQQALQQAHQQVHQQAHQQAQQQAHQQVQQQAQQAQQAQQPQQAQHAQQLQQTHSHSQLSSLAQLAQLAAQQYLTTQTKTAPAIVTGFEHFTPEQQAQIKAQLSTHLGSNFHAVSNTNSNPNQYSAKYVAQENLNFVPSPQVKNEQVTTASSQTIGDILKARFLMKN